MENGKIEVLLIDGPLAGRVVHRPDYHSFPVLHDFSNCFNFGSGPGVELGLRYSQVTYDVHTYGESVIDEELLFWVFPNRGRFVQWESSDLHWAKPLCRVAPIRVYRTWHVASIGPIAPYQAATVKSKVAPCVRFAVDTPLGYVLPIDTPASRILEIINRQPQPATSLDPCSSFEIRRRYREAARGAFERQLSIFAPR